MKDDCLVETVGEGCDPPVPGVKGLAFGLKAIQKEGETHRWRQGSNDSFRMPGA